LDANGKPLLGDGGIPIIVQHVWITQEDNGEDNEHSFVSQKVFQTQTMETRSSEIVPAGRMLTLSKMRCKDVPNVDRGGGSRNLSDPYLICALVSDQGEILDEARTAHQNNAWL